MSKLFLFILYSLLIIFLQCSQSTKPDPMVIKIQDVWFSDLVDSDNDNYFSDANLYFKLTVNKSSADVFVVLGVRVTNSEDTDPYVPCFTSVSLEISQNSDNTWYIPIHNLDFTLTQGSYDFHLQVFLSNNPDKVAAEALPSSDLDIYNVAFESLEEDSAIKTDWLSHHDGNFEAGESGFRGRLYVYFDKPAETITCIIKEIRIYIFKSEDPANTSFTLKVYSDSVIYNNTFSNNSVGWKSIPVNLNISETNNFHVDLLLPYDMLNPSDPIKLTIGFDTDTKNADKSYTLFPAPQGLTPLGGELGVEVFVEYTTGISKVGTKIERPISSQKVKKIL